MYNRTVTGHKDAWKEGDKLNKELITPNVIEECLCESFDIVEKIQSHDKSPKNTELAS